MFGAEKTVSDRLRNRLKKHVHQEHMGPGGHLALSLRLTVDQKPAT